MPPKAPYAQGSSVKIIQTSGLNYVPPSAFYQPPKDTITGVRTPGSSWWTAGQPILPIAPEGTSPVGFQFLSEQNKIFTPRATEYLTFDDLRRLATYPVAAIMINEHANAVAARKFRIRLRQLPGQNNKDREAAEKKDPKILQLTNFFMNPNPDMTWREWVYMWIHEVQTTDAPAIFVRRNARRDIAELRLIDGTIIARYIDDNGWTPSNESPAYAQLWWGTPAWDLTRDQLFYRPKSPRVYKIYGNSPTERSSRLLELGFSRLELKLQWAQNGTIPDGLMVVPPDAPMELVERQQAWMNSVMTGNSQRRVQLRLIQGFAKDGKDQLLFPKEKMLMDPYDEYEIRMLAVNYGTSKQRYMAQMNRASADAAQEAAEEEGTGPSHQYILDSMNILIQSPLYFNLPAYEFSYEDQRERDVLKQAQADDLYIKNGTKTWNETRDALGLDAYQSEKSDDLADSPLAFANPIYNAYDSATEAAAAKQPKLPSGELGESSGQAGEVIPPTGRRKSSKLAGRIVLDAVEVEDQNRSQVAAFLAATRVHGQLEKTHVGMTIDPHHFSLQSETARSRLEAIIEKRLGKIAATFVAKIKTTKLRKSDDEDIKRLLDDDEFWTSLWIDLPDDLTPDLEAAVRSGMAKGILETGVSVSSKDAINKFNQLAHAYAQKRAAEMVGMKYDAEGELVLNPKAQYTISEPTRTELRQIITEAFEEETPMAELVQEIQDAGSFSIVRAQNIAKTEVSFAQSGGTYEVWKQTGVVKTYFWQNSNLANVCDVCLDNAAAGEIEFGKAFPSGDKYPPAHPGGCRCVVVASKTGKSIAA
jgi:hypothetical protein